MNNPAPSTAETLKAPLSLPVIVAPMFLVSSPGLVVASCREGLMGSLPAAANWTSQAFGETLEEINQGLNKLKTAGITPAPYAVNLSVRKPSPRLDADIDLCVKYKVPVILASGDVTPEFAKKIHAYGGIILQDVASSAEARHAIANGADGLIAVTTGAGGQGGTLNPLALIGEIRQFFDGPLALAGCISTGQDIVAAQAMGADFAVMGTRFVATAESNADPAYKQMIVDAVASDIIYTTAISGAPANFMRQSIEAAGLDAEKLKKEGIAAERIKPPPGEESKAWKTIWAAGQGAGNIHDVPTVADLAIRLKQEYAAGKAALLKKLGITPATTVPKAPKGPQP